jgi:hypothetical protein
MVVCAVRCEPVSLLFGQYQGDFRKKQGAGGRKCQKRLQHKDFEKFRYFHIREEQGAWRPGITDQPSSELRALPLKCQTSNSLKFNTFGQNAPGPLLDRTAA